MKGFKRFDSQHVHCFCCENFVALLAEKRAETPYPCMQAVNAAHACKAAHASKADLTHENALLVVKLNM
jgi:hypothetical protein